MATKKTTKKQTSTKKNNIKLTKEQEAQISNIKKEIEEFQKKVLEKFDKYVTGITLLPVNKEKSEDINILVLVDDTDSKKMSKEELKNKLGSIIQTIGKEVNPKIVANTLITSELLESCYDGKSEYLELIAQSAIVFDKGMLAAVKIGEIHKKMIISKFEKYIVTYALFGSLTRGEAHEESDIDVAIIIDDTDVKRMTRAELKDKLRAIIIGMGMEAGEMTGIKNKLNIQVYILTDFWESVRDANPVIFTVLRDGVPFYDRGIFMPWKQLLKMGKIKPSQESIDMFINTGDEIIKRIRGKIKNLVESDIYWATLTPSQAALMIYGVPPPTPTETIRLMEDLFVKKEKLLEPEYIDILKKNRKYYKDIEHGTVKEVSGKEVDELLNDSEKYLKRIKKLFDELYILREKETLVDIKDNVITATREILKTQNVQKTSQKEILAEFEKHIVDKGIVPNKFLTFLKKITTKIEDTQKITKTELNKLKKTSAEYIKSIVEITQRINLRKLESLKLKIKHDKNKISEIILLEDKIYILEKENIKQGSIKDGQISNIKKTTEKKLEEDLLKVNYNTQKPALNTKLLKSLEDIFGESFEIIF